MSFGKFLVGWLGITTVCALGAHYIYPGRDGIAATLQSYADVVKTEQFADWATVSFVRDGKMRDRVAYVSGVAPSEEAKNALAAALLARHGQMNVANGGIQRVEFVEGGSQPVAASDYSFRAEVVGNDVVLSGIVPSDTVRDELVQAAQARFVTPKRNVIDKMTVRAGTMQPGWSDVAKRGIGYVGALGNQYAELTGSVLAVVGKSSDVKLIEQIEAEVANQLPPNFQGRATIDGPTTTATVTPEVQAQVDTCQEDMNAAMTGRSIEFDTGRAALREVPNPLIDSIAAIADKCPKVRIEIAGHTDSRGNDAANLALSQARAAVVAKYLADKGIAPGALVPTGYGETQPVDPADTPEALQKNRRIEFKLSANPAQ